MTLMMGKYDAVVGTKLKFIEQFYKMTSGRSKYNCWKEGNVLYTHT